MTLAEQIAEARKQGFSDDQIRQVVQQAPDFQKALDAGYSASDALTALDLASTGEKAGRLADIGATGFTKGVASVAGVPGTIESLADEYLPTPVAKGVHLLDSFGPIGALHGISNLLGYGGKLPTTSDVFGALDSAGLKGPTPVTDPEEWTNALALGAGAAVPAVLAGVPPTGALATSLNSAATAELSHRLVPGSDLAPVIGGFVGGLGTEGAMGVAASAARNRLLKMTEAEAGAKGSALDTLKSANSNAQDLLKELRSQRGDMVREHGEDYDAAMKDHFDTIAQLNNEATQNIAQTTQGAQKTLDTTASGLSPAETLQDAGTVAQKSATNWRGGMDKRVGDILNPLYEKIDQNTPVALSNFKSALSDINSDAGALESLNQTLKPSLPRELAGRLQALEEGSTLSGQPFNPSVRDLQTLRSSLGRAMSDPKILNSTGGQNAAHLYAALTQDLRKPFADQGLGAEFDSANAQTKNIYDFARNVAGKVISSESGKGNAAPETVASSLLGEGKKGATTLAQLRSEMPDAADALASTAIKSGQWKTLAPEAKAALVPDASSRSAIDTAFASQDAATQAANAARDAQIKQAQAGLRNLRFTHRAELRALDSKISDTASTVNRTGKAVEAAGQERDSIAATLAAMREAQGGRSKTLDYLNSQPFLAKMATGAGLGTLGATLLHSLGMPEASVPASIAAGEMLPFGLSAAERVISNPKVLAGPTYGASIGGALGLQQQQGRQ